MCHETRNVTEKNEIKLFLAFSFSWSWFFSFTKSHVLERFFFFNKPVHYPLKLLFALKVSCIKMCESTPLYSFLSIITRNKLSNDLGCLCSPFFLFWCLLLQEFTVLLLSAWSPWDLPSSAWSIFCFFPSVSQNLLLLY